MTPSRIRVPAIIMIVIISGSARHAGSAGVTQALAATDSDDLPLLAATVAAVTVPRHRR